VVAAKAVVPAVIANAVFEPTGIYALAAPVRAEEAAFAGQSTHLARVAYAVPNVPVAIVAEAAGEVPVVTVR
jgi:hypothetical protein